MALVRASSPPLTLMGRVSQLEEFYALHEGKGHMRVNAPLKLLL